MSNRHFKLKLIIKEIIAHFWLSAAAVVSGVALIFLADTFLPKLNYKAIFHNFHYAHIFFASATATLVGHRFSKNWIRSLLVGILIPPIFCTTSDIFLPYLGGLMSGADMKLHLCVMHHRIQWLGFVVSGAVFGIIFSRLSKFSIWTACITSHFLHDFVSTVSSLGYLASFGFFAWKTSLIYTTLFLMVAVLVPCMISDIVLPVMLCAKKTSGSSTIHCCTEKDGRN